MPPYNIENKGKNQYRITMTVAGFAADEIELVRGLRCDHGSKERAA